MPPKTFIFVDGSYYCFYRYHAMLRWMKLANPDDPDIASKVNEEPFMQKMCDSFGETLRSLPKRLKIPKEVDPILLVGKDCKRQDIWRTVLFEKYKANRVHEHIPFFERVYSENMFEAAGAKGILYHPHLEADDCIALSVMHILEKEPESIIYIITSDRDYLQLLRPGSHLHIYSLASPNVKNLAEGKTCYPEGDKNLLMKVLMGDSSDNIPSAFPKCGPVTAMKCVADEELMKKKLEGHMDQWELNQQLINFHRIPAMLRQEFLASFQHLF